MSACQTGLCIHQESALDKKTAQLLVKIALSQLDARKLGPKARDPQRKAPTRPSCAPTTAYNPIRFTLPNALTYLSAGQLGSYLSNSLRTIHCLNIASTQAINFAKYPPSQRHTFTIAAARLFFCNFRRHCPQQTLANGSSTGLKSLPHCQAQVGVKHGLLFAGPRVKMGIYEGIPTHVAPHTTTGSADYFGRKPD